MFLQLLNIFVLVKNDQKTVIKDKLKYVRYQLKAYARQNKYKLKKYKNNKINQITEQLL